MLDFGLKDEKLPVFVGKNYRPDAQQRGIWLGSNHFSFGKTENLPFGLISKDQAEKLIALEQEETILQGDSEVGLQAAQNIVALKRAVIQHSRLVTAENARQALLDSAKVTAANVRTMWQVISNTRNCDPYGSTAESLVGGTKSGAWQLARKSAPQLNDDEFKTVFNVVVDAAVIAEGNSWDGRTGSHVSSDFDYVLSRFERYAGKKVTDPATAYTA